MNHYALFTKATGTRTRCGQVVARREASAAALVTCPKCRDLLAVKVAAEVSAAEASEGQERQLHEGAARYFARMIAA